MGLLVLILDYISSFLAVYLTARIGTLASPPRVWGLEMRMGIAKGRDRKARGNGRHRDEDDSTARHTAERIPTSGFARPGWDVYWDID